MCQIGLKPEVISVLSNGQQDCLGSCQAAGHGKTLAGRARCSAEKGCFSCWKRGNPELDSGLVKNLVCY